jgi:hypothetical protein
MIKKPFTSILSSNVFSFVGAGAMMGGSFFEGQPGSATAPEPNSAYASLIASHSPSFYWELNEATAVTSAVPTIGSVNGSAVGAASAGASTLVSATADASWRFNGTNSALDLGRHNLGPVLNGASAITIEAWVQSDSLGADDAVFVTYVGDDGTTQFGVALDNTASNTLRLSGRSKLSDTLQSITHTISAGAQTSTLHVIGVLNYATDSMSMWVNGATAVVSTAKTFASTAYSYASAGVSQNDHIGAIPGSSRWWNGKIGHVAVYTTALSASAIVDHYNAGFVVLTYSETVVADGAVLYWHLSEASAATSAVPAIGSVYGSAVGGASAGASTVVSTTMDTSWRFNGTSGGLNLGLHGVGAAMHGASAITLEMWLHPDELTTSGADTIFPMYVRASDFGGTWIDVAPTNAIRVLSRSVSTDSLHIISHTVSAALASSVMHFIAIADFANDNMSMFINGVTAVASTTKAFASSVFTYSSAVRVGDNFIGKDEQFGRYYNGKVGHVAMYRSALSASTIVDHYNKGIGDT